MATKTLTNQELVDLVNGLHKVKDLKGVKFALVVAKNIEMLQKELEHIDEASKPSEEFMKVSTEVQDCMKNGKEEEAKKLEEENKKLVDERKVQIEEVQVLLKEESTINIYTVYSNQLPGDITADQIMSVRNIIIDN
jgi:cell fate (sporulation/competence/biofilm development) regulator YlbF (YheA/YmcA/DUF963 family)